MSVNGIDYENEAVNAAGIGETAAAVSTEPVKKVSRRGVASARGTTRLKFSHEQARKNGLFLAHLESVTVTTSKIGEDNTNMPSFNGMEIPRIAFLFASNEPDANKRHYVTLSFNAVESNVNTIEKGKEAWKVDSVLDWFHHILDVFIFKGRKFDEETENALVLGFTDTDADGQYVPVEPEEVVAAWKVLFENMENIMNRGNNGSPIYKTADGKDIILWIKLLRYVRSRNKGWQPVSNGDLAFPTFVGDGCIEISVANAIPCIHLDSVKESIIPMNIEKPKAPNMPAVAPGMGMNPVMGGVAVDQSMGGFAGGFMPTDNIAAEAVEDLPF